MPRWLFWPVFAAVMGFTLGGSIGWSIDHPKQNQDVKYSHPGATISADQHQTPGTVRQRLSIIWKRTWEDPVAFYTFVLGIFTALLAVISAVQIGFLFRADATSRIAANAATTHAKAAVRAEAPLVFLRRLELIPPLFKGGQAWDFHAFPPMDSGVALVFLNIGRSHAIVSSVCWDASVSLRLPKEPEYRTIFPIGTGTTIKEENGTYTFRLENRTIGITDADRDAMEKVEKYLWVYGYLEYRDFMGEPHRTGFCGQYMRQPAIGGGIQKPMFFEGGPPAYTYQT